MSAGGTTQLTEPADPADAAEPLELDPVTLPETRRTGRKQRKKHQRRRRRRRGLGVLLVLALVGGLIGMLVSFWPSGGVGGARNDGDRQAGEPGGAAPPSPKPVLLAQQQGSGPAVSLTVLVPAASGKGGTLVLIPPGTMTEVVALGLEPVGRSLDLGGPSRLRATVENLLGASLGDVSVMNDDGIAAMLRPIGPLTVRLVQPVEQVDKAGRVEVLFQAGANRIEPDGVAGFLSAKGRGNDLERLARHQAFWDAWLAALKAQPAAAPTKPVTLATAFTALVDGPVRTRVVPVESFGTSPEDGELYKVRAAELTRMVAASFPAAAKQGAQARPRVQILNGTGAVGLADSVRNRLGAAFDVRLTGNAATFTHDKTEVVFYARDKQAMAEKVRRALGVGTLVFSRRPLDVVDVTIVVGKDFKP
ncbi:MAG TPA: LytR C-terminal domain-containing protein [Acidimicrobiales bacterium]|nr:LytR C-terminal domain-containing protein [Acidimicrobiales bacterium]